MTVIFVFASIVYDICCVYRCKYEQFSLYVQAAMVHHVCGS